MLAVLVVTTEDAVTAIAGSRGPASLRRELVGFRAPDVVVLDVTDTGAPELVAALAAAIPDARLLVVGPAEEADVGLACVRAGAHGVISRDEATDGLDLALRLLQAVPPASAPATTADVMTTGATNRAIAERLGLSEKAVKGEATAIYATLGAANRTEAVALWSRLRGVPA